MIERKGWEYDSDMCEWVNNDYAYPVSVAPDIDGRFYATLWIEHPGVRTFSNGDPGFPPDWEAQDLGLYEILGKAMEVAVAAAAEAECRDARMYAEWELIAAKGGWDD